MSAIVRYKRHSSFINYAFNLSFRVPSSNSTLWPSSIWCWFSYGWLWCMFTFKVNFSSSNRSLQEKGTHLYQLCPSANYYSCKCQAIGARSQSARTYLEKNLDKFVDSNQDELIKHCMRALRDTLPNEVELTVKVYSSFSVISFASKCSLELCCCNRRKGYTI